MISQREEATTMRVEWTRMIHTDTSIRATCVGIEITSKQDQTIASSFGDGSFEGVEGGSSGVGAARGEIAKGNEEMVRQTSCAVDTEPRHIITVVRVAVPDSSEWCQCITYVGGGTAPVRRCVSGSAAGEVKSRVSREDWWWKVWTNPGFL